MTMKIRMKMKNRSHMYDINGPRPRMDINKINAKYKMYNYGYMY